MNVEIDVDAELLEKAKGYSGIQDDAAVVHEGLRKLVGREVARRLIALGGSDPEAVAGRRRAL
jgi:Arc/MetJ family transcription regulator